MYYITLPDCDTDYVTNGGSALKYGLYPDANNKWSPRANSYRVFSGTCNEGDEVTLTNPTGYQEGVTIRSFNWIGFANTTNDFIAISMISNYTNNIRAGILTSTTYNSAVFGVSGSITGDWSVKVDCCSYMTMTASSSNSSRTTLTIKAIYVIR